MQPLISLYSAIRWPRLALACVGAFLLNFSLAAVPDDMLAIGKAADPQTLDPAVTIDNNDWTVTYHAYQRLVQYKVENGQGSTEVEGDLAASWTVSPDQKIWTFTLKPEAKFNDGTAVTAEAVKWSFERLMAIKQGPSEAYPSDLKVTVIDPLTVQFSMGTQFAPFLYTLANNGASIINPAIAKQYPEDEGRAWLSNHTAGSGPYTLERWQKGQQLVLVPNPHFSGDKPAFKRVIVKIIGESSTRRLQLTRGDLDIAESLPIDQLTALKTEDKVKVYDYPSLRVTYLYINNAKAPLDQVALRRAISWTVDYQGMISGILAGNGQQMRGPIPDGMWGYDPNAMQFSYDLDKAKAELANVATVPKTLTFLYSANDPNWESIALSLQASLDKIGIKVTLEKLANATMRDRVGQGNYDLAIGNWSPDFADPYMYMNYWFGADKKGLPGNRAFYDNSAVDALLQQAIGVSDQAARTEFYQAAQKLIIEDAAYVYLYQRNYQVGVNKKIQNFVYNPMLEQVFNIGQMHK